MSIRFRSFSDEKLQSFLDQLVEQQTSGVASVSYNGETTTFSSPANIERAILSIETELDRREAAAAGKTRRRSWVFNPGVMSGKGYL